MTNQCTGCAVAQGTHTAADGLAQAQEEKAPALAVAERLYDNAEMDEAEGANPYVVQLERLAEALLKQQYARIAELEAQLEAIGAGGVEPLRKPAAQQGAQPEGEAIAEIVSASHDDAEFGERAINLLRDFNHLEYGTKLYAHPAPQGMDTQTKAARSVLAERARQVTAEGWAPERDDEYARGILGEAGGIYALHAFDQRRAKEVPEGWPWDDVWWKPKDPRTNLVKAGALILAEIERMDRSFAAQAAKGISNA